MMEHNHIGAWMQEIRRNKALALVVAKAKVVDSEAIRWTSPSPSRRPQRPRLKSRPSPSRSNRTASVASAVAFGRRRWCCVVAEMSRSASGMAHWTPSGCPQAK